MSFANPGILYALLLLLIPVIIHLVRWKRFKTELFTNVEMLQELEIKSRKSRKLKELLVLLLRLLALAMLVLAFAKPFYDSKALQQNISKSKNFIYLDNSRSLDAITNKTNFWQTYLQDLQQNIKDNQTYTLLTNERVYPELNTKSLKKILPGIKLTGKITEHNKILKKIGFLLATNKKTQNNILYLSDLQNVKNEQLTDTLFQTDNNYYFVVKNNSDLPNISIDSIWQTGKDRHFYRFNLKVSATKKYLTTPVTIKENNEILWRSFINFKDSLTQDLTVNIPVKPDIEAVIQINDQGFQFDNRMFFTLHQPEKINILVLGNQIPEYIKKIYTPDEFNLKLTPVRNLNINDLDQFDLVVLTQLNKLSGYTGSLKNYVNNYGNLLILPDDKQASILQNLLQDLNIRSQVSLDTSKVFLNHINYSHPILKKAFTKAVRNFAYPVVKNHYRLSRNGHWLYRLSDQSPFAQVFNRNGNIYLINTPLNPENTNFTDAATLVVTLFYQIAKSHNNRNTLYYLTGHKNNWTVKVETKPDLTLRLENENEKFTPFQINQYKQITVTTEQLPTQAGIYKVVYQGHKIGSVAYNYDRRENRLKYLKIPKINNVKQVNSIQSFVMEQEAFFKSQDLWRWFVILALVFLLLEMLVLRFWK